MENNIRTSNINAEWLNNIYENIKNIEQQQRLAKEGCISVFDYYQTPPEQRLRDFADVQYKNLRFMITEFDLLLSDLTPNLMGDKNKKEALLQFIDAIEKLEEVVQNKKLFVREIKDGDGVIKRSSTTKFFSETLNHLGKMKRELFKEIKHILFVETTEGY